MNDHEPVHQPVKVPCEVYTRVVGYLRPRDSFNAGKQQEAKERVTFAINASDDANAAKCAALPAAASGEGSDEATSQTPA